eukprot:Phypoly_transcript_10200.p1 GENE.Phypoly_transcript_10200~~Phypoly_transcript_10200.p1  ORF type:complete len:314 (+),score=31.31 Phypoly_transcript_10200:352-1293(+)
MSTVDCFFVPAKGEIPPPKQAVEGTLLSDNEFVIFGGGPVEGPYTNTVHKLDLTTHTWTLHNPEVRPPPRGVMSLAAHNGILYMFGGYSDRTHLNDFYSFNFETNEWTKLSTEGGPSPRRGASMVAYKDKLYLYGGSATRGAGAYDEIFSYDIANKKWTLERKGVGSYRHSAAIYNDTMYIFGGDQAKGFSNHVLTYHFITKEFRYVQIPTVPPALEAHCAAVLGDKMIVYGGLMSNSVFNNQVFILNLQNNTWSAAPTTINEISASGPGSRIFFASGNTNEKLVVFGGRYDHTPHTFAYFNDTWVLKLLSNC